MVNTSNYKLYLAKNNVTSANSLVGTFRKKDDPGFNCEIIMNDAAVEDSGFAECATTMFPDKAVIYVTVNMMIALREDNPLAIFNLYRELAHIECGHFDVKEGSEEMDDEQLAKMMLDQEIEADAFASEFVGKEQALEMLRELLKTKAQIDRELHLNGTSYSVKQIRQYRARIQALSKE